MDLTIEHIKKAYLFVKNYIYHENLNLFLKQRVAEFETSHTEIQDVFESILKAINQEQYLDNEDFKDWIERIGYHLLPKVVECKKDKENEGYGLFISNVRESEQYTVSKVNYFINAPVEIHIIEMLWCLFAGPALEERMSKDCYGNRMHSSALNFHKNNSIDGKEIFKRYIDQYDQWRDQALKVATEVSQNGDDVALFSLDLMSCFYHIDLDFKYIEDEVEKYYSDNAELKKIAIKLSWMLADVYAQYQKVIARQIQITHMSCRGKRCLPIGFASAAIIANWYLSEFDCSIEGEVRPAYYGRYVDDILMVFKRPKFDVKNSIASFVENYLNLLLVYAEDIKNYKYGIVVGKNLLPVQEDKLILQFFDKEHSRAGLDLFKKELDEKSSAFKFLPNDHIDKELDRFAYDVLYDGSANKLRNIVGLTENETELAKYLSSHITAHRLCKLNKRDVVLPQLKQFFRGLNTLRFFRLWEKLYQYSVITRNYDFVSFFYKYVENEIKKISFIKQNGRPCKVVAKKLMNDLILYNKISISITTGLLDVIEPFSDAAMLFTEELNVFSSLKSVLGEIIDYASDMHLYSWQFRYSNLIRHHLVAWPLANYSLEKNDLTL